MKIEYKGFEIEVHRGDSLSGDSYLYYSILRIEDGWFLDDSFEDSEEILEDKVEQLKDVVEDYLENPQDYDEF